MRKLINAVCVVLLVGCGPSDDAHDAYAAAEADAAADAAVADVGFNNAPALDAAESEIDYAGEIALPQAEVETEAVTTETTLPPAAETTSDSSGGFTDDEIVAGVAVGVGVGIICWLTSCLERKQSSPSSVSAGYDYREDLSARNECRRRCNNIYDPNGYNEAAAIDQCLKGCR